MRTIFCKTLALLGLALPACSAVAADDNTYFSGLWSDGVDYFTAPARWGQQEWLTLGTTLIAVSALEEQDDHVRSIYANRDKELSGAAAEAANIGNSWGEPLWAIGAMSALYGYGKLTDNPLYVDTSSNMFRAALYSTVTTHLLKMAIGRDRPSETANDDSYSGKGRSFPSGHTTFAFALSTAFAESVEHPSLLRRVGAYGLATATAFARVYDNKHWTSDVAAGAAIGIASGLFVTRKMRGKRSSKWDVIIAPTPGGATVGGEIRF